MRLDDRAKSFQENHAAALGKRGQQPCMCLDSSVFTSPNDLKPTHRQTQRVCTPVMLLWAALKPTLLDKSDHHCRGCRAINSCVFDNGRLARSAITSDRH
jgi:hypothetical protein